MKSQFIKTALLPTMFLIASNALACETGGNQCNESTMPSIIWGPNAAVQLGAEGITLGKGLSAADGAGETKISKAWSFTEGNLTLGTKTSLVGDNIAGCTSCGDNQIGLTIDGTQKTIAGSANETLSNNGGAESGAEAIGFSKIGGAAWGQMGGTLNIK